MSYLFALSLMRELPPKLCQREETTAMESEKGYLDFNMLLVKELKERYEENLKWIADEIPAVINFNSPKQIKSLMEERLDMIVDSVTIQAVEGYRDLYDHDSEAFDLCNGILLYLRCKYTLSNYINCILKHEENGRVYLRQERGEWLLPNKRPLTESPEIKECITASYIPKRRRTKYGSNK
jgi:hypothetical protein